MATEMMRERGIEGIPALARTNPVDEPAFAHRKTCRGARAEVLKAERVAKERGHTIGRWYQRNGFILMASCIHCEKLGWLLHPSFEGWRPGGPLLEEVCGHQLRLFEL